MKNSDNADARRRDIISTIAYEYKWPDFQTKPHRLFSMSSALFALGIATVEKPPIPRRLLRRVVDVSVTIRYVRSPPRFSSVSTSDKAPGKFVCVLLGLKESGLIPAKTNIGSFLYLVERDDLIFNWHISARRRKIKAAKACCGQRTPAALSYN